MQPQQAGRAGHSQHGNPERLQRHGGAAQPAGDARFLILPHLRVPHLASAILGRITRRLPADWQNTYGYTPVLAETFVDAERFTGTCYQAANWIHVGTTQGRGKLDRHHQQALPIKDVYLKPLHRNYQALLTTAL